MKDEIETGLGLDALKTIKMGLQEITDEQVIYWGESRMDPKDKKETVIGRIEDMKLKKLNVLCATWMAKSRSRDSDAKAASSKEAELEAKSDSARMNTLGELARDLFWAEVHSQFAHWDKNIGVRRGWDIVEMPETDDNGMPPFLKKLLGGDLD